MQWQQPNTQNFAVAVVLNDAHEALVLKKTDDSTELFNWELLMGYMGEQENPLDVMQSRLMTVAGYFSTDWIYLGTFETGSQPQSGVGHFFLAKNAKKLESAQSMRGWQVAWVPLKQLKLAILDGRISRLSHAMNVAMAFLTVLD
ncbi:MAG: hypothetical protein Kow0080_13690 [Candidatus Promineifilaceae bacterium]